MGVFKELDLSRAALPRDVEALRRASKKRIAYNLLSKGYLGILIGSVAAPAAEKLVSGNADVGLFWPIVALGSVLGWRMSKKNKEDAQDLQTDLLKLIGDDRISYTHHLIREKARSN